MKSISLVGAAAVYDWAHRVDKLPKYGDIVYITDTSGTEPLQGGCALGLSVALAKLGIEKPQLFWPVGDDFEVKGSIYEEVGVDCTYLCHVKGEKCGFAHLFVQEDGTSMCFSYPGVAKLGRANPDAKMGDMVVITPVMHPYCEEYLEMAKKQGSEIVFSGIVGSQLVPHMEYAKYIFMNDHEMEILAGCLGLNDVSEVVAKYPNATFFVTYGIRGSRVYHEGKIKNVELIKEERNIDTTGCGDSYAAGTLFGILNGLSPLDSAVIGSALASFVVEEFGAQTGLPTLEKLSTRLPEETKKLLGI